MNELLPWYSNSEVCVLGKRKPLHCSLVTHSVCSHQVIVSSLGCVSLWWTGLHFGSRGNTTSHVLSIHNARRICAIQTCHPHINECLSKPSLYPAKKVPTCTQSQFPNIHWEGRFKWNWEHRGRAPLAHPFSPEPHCLAVRMPGQLIFLTWICVNEMEP